LLQVIVDSISLGSLYALFALGIGLIFSVMGLINFAHGELLMVGGYALVFVPSAPLGIRIFILLVVVAVFALGMERSAFRLVRGASIETLLVTSFSVSFLLQSLAILFIGARPRSIGVLRAFSGSLTVGSVNVRKLDLLTIAVTAVLLSSLVLFLGKMRLGLQMRAAAENFFVTRALGVRANTVIATAFALSGILAGVASLIFFASSGIVHPAVGPTPVLMAFIAAIIGGLGSLPGAVAGGYILGAVTVILQVLLPPELRSYRDTVVFLAVVAMLVARPQGIVASRGTRTV
jgi:branched-chain amino acid transport system permease protein